MAERGNAADGESRGRANEAGVRLRDACVQVRGGESLIDPVRAAGDDGEGGLEGSFAHQAETRIGLIHLKNKDADSALAAFRRARKIAPEDPGPLAGVPMLVKDRAVGVVEVINKEAADGFSEGDVELATALANLAAIALDNARMYAQLADAVVAARMSYRL